MDFSILIMPVAGAVLGYSTNWLAIKMLFRPYYEKRLFGMKLPFTPGLIPKGKTRLARSIGQTFAKNILTEEGMAKAIASPAVMDKLQGFIDGFLENLRGGEYDDKIEELLEMVSGKFAEHLAENKHTLADYTSGDVPEKLMRFLSVKIPEFALLLKALPEKYPDVDEKINSAVKKIAEDNFGSFLGIFIKYDQLYEKFKDSAFSWLSDEANTQFVAFKISSLVNSFLQKEVGELYDKAGDALNADKLLKNIARALLSGLTDERARRINSFIMENMGRLAVKIGTFLSSAIKFDELIENKINESTVQEVEEMTLAIVKKELKWITLLGGIIGFVVGFIPVFLG